MSFSIPVVPLSNALHPVSVLHASGRPRCGGSSCRTGTCFSAPTSSTFAWCHSSVGCSVSSRLLRPGPDLKHRKRVHECFTRSHERRGFSAASSGAHCTRGPRSPGVGVCPLRGAALRSALDEPGALVLSSAQPRGLGHATGRQRYPIGLAVGSRRASGGRRRRGRSSSPPCGWRRRSPRAPREWAPALSQPVRSLLGPSGRAASQGLDTGLCRHAPVLSDGTRGSLPGQPRGVARRALLPRTQPIFWPESRTLGLGRRTGGVHLPRGGGLARGTNCSAGR